MQFRKATDADIGLLAQLNRQLIEDEGHRNQMSLPELEQRMRSWLQKDYEAVIFKHDNHPVAYALFRHHEDTIHLRQFFVERQYRRQGFGRRAMHILLSQVWPLEQRVTLEVLVNNQNGYSFWKSLGFREYAVTFEMLPGEKPAR